MTRRVELTGEIALMQYCSFGIGPPAQDSYVRVQIAMPEQSMARPSECYTMYVTCLVVPERFPMLTSWMSMHGLVVMYPPVYSKER